MHPLAQPGDSQPCLIRPDDGRTPHRVLERGLSARERFITLFGHPVDGAGRDATGEEVTHRLGGAGDGDKLVQVGGSRPQPRFVADRRGDMGGEGCLRLGAARRSAPGLCLVLGDEEADVRGVDELAALVPRRLCRGERGAAAAALYGRVGDDLVGRGSGGRVEPWCRVWPPTFLPVRCRRLLVRGTPVGSEGGGRLEL